MPNQNNLLEHSLDCYRTKELFGKMFQQKVILSLLLLQFQKKEWSAVLRRELEYI